jgi:hypothetical protein
VSPLLFCRFALPTSPPLAAMKAPPSPPPAPFSGLPLPLPLLPLLLSCTPPAVTGRSIAAGPAAEAMYAGPISDSATGSHTSPASSENRIVPKISAKNVRRICRGVGKHLS